MTVTKCLQFNPISTKLMLQKPQQLTLLRPCVPARMRRRRRRWWRRRRRWWWWWYKIELSLPCTYFLCLNTVH
jgi:hypothetical protein